MSTDGLLARGRTGRVAAGRSRSLPVWLHISLLWLAFVAAFAYDTITVLVGPHTPLNDVTTTYHDWILQGQEGLGWVGIDQVWVYPSLALAPMAFSAVAGLANYDLVWLVMVFVLFAITLSVLTRGGTRRRAAGWWLLAFLTLLGPISVGRIDAISLPFGVLGVLYAARRPAIASVLLTIGAWIKVWPAALVLALVVATKHRVQVAVAAVATTVVVVIGLFVVGASTNTVLGFVSQQSGRGLQLEAPVTTIWLWMEMLHTPGVITYFNHDIITFETIGPGAHLASMLMTPIMVAIMLGVVVVGAVALRRGADAVQVLGPLALGLTTTFIVANKVGSPQYEVWLAAPVLLGMLLARRGGVAFRVPAILVLIIAGFTQVLYPWNYDALVLAEPWMVAWITARNLLLVVLLAWCVVQLAVLCRARPVTASAVVDAGPVDVAA